MNLSQVSMCEDNFPVEPPVFLTTVPRGIFRYITEQKSTNCDVPLFLCGLVCIPDSVVLLLCFYGP